MLATVVFVETSSVEQVGKHWSKAHGLAREGTVGKETVKGVGVVEDKNKVNVMVPQKEVVEETEDVEVTKEVETEPVRIVLGR